ncbi:MAG: M20/M25/M40 family metallo-hydrolase [Christensenellales bacterium]
MRLKKRLTALILLVSLVAGVALGYLQLLPPALPEGFSEETVTLDGAKAGPDLALMLSHLKAMASQVHSVDSDGLRVTQTYLKDQLARLGYSFEEESYALGMAEILQLERERTDYRKRPFTATEEGIRAYSGIGDKPTMNLNNIVVRLDAPGTEETVIFCAHTDSVKAGPGAFDDTVSVAAMLEALRLLEGQPLQRDLVFLFSDGEEQGMLGAAKFVQDHPELQPVTKMVFNIEARGNQGVLMMFETSANNFAMASAYAQAVPRPFAMSIAGSVYRTMKNDTDLTRFMMAAYPGMNFSVIQGAEVYHTAQDNYEGFSRQSANHYLQQVTGLALYAAGSRTLQLAAREDGVFFPFLPGRLVVMGQGTANLLAYAAAALFLALTVLLLARGKAKAGTLLAAAGLQLGLILLAGGISFLVVKLVLGLNYLSSYYDILSFGPAQPIFYALTAVLSALGALVFFRVFRKTGSSVSVALGVLLLPALLALATTFLFPSASYLFSLSVLGGLLALLLGRLIPLGIPAGLFNLGTLLLFLPLCVLVFIALSFSLAYAAVALWMLPFTMLLGLMLSSFASKES